ncbi:response regulator [Geobacter sp. AOG2]|uniref:response regulator n=1 Tax=Geobacter sp. AOG2 TaxID=1566347 RepID=UPI001CC80D52|nr:response regulator [Geobacter sp. AOG2]GFE60581.1 hypothetical protein AOG2_11690 [Geobacter sp. AOG2]
MLKFFNRRSIRTKLLLIIMFSAMPIALAFLYFLKFEYDQSYREAKHDVLVAVQSIALEHNSQVEGIRNLLITLSQFPEIQRMDPEACMKILNHILVQSPSNLNIGIADPDGNVIATGVKQSLPIRYKVNDRKYFQDALRTKKFSSGEFTVSRAVGKPTFHFALPILDPSGNPQFVLYAALDLTRLKSQFEAQHFPAGSAFSLIDHKGVLLYRYPDLSRLKYGSSDAPHLWKQMINDHESGVFVDVGRDGVKRVFGFQRLRLGPGEAPFLYIRASVPDRLVISKTYKLLGIILGISLVAVMVSYLFSSILARLAFILPIEKLSTTVRAVENGDLSSKSGLTYLEDEIGQLALSFDAMTESLAEKESARILAEDLLQDKNNQLEREIIERKRKEQLFRDLFQNVADPIYISDMSGKILNANVQACNELGYSYEELLTKHITELDAYYPDPEEVKALLRNLTDSKLVTFETKHLRKDNSQFCVEIHASYINYDGYPAIMGVARNVDERKKAAQEHLKLEQQLLHAQKLESLGVLAGGIAHDFNNILTSIIGNADLALLRINKESPGVENLHKIEEAATRAADLARQMLAYSGKGKFVIESINLNRLLEDMLHMLEVSISKKAVLRLNLNPDIPAVEADATQIRQIVMNLVINASEAIGDKSGVIAVTTGCMECDKNYLKDVWLVENISQGTYVYLEIADTGCGMDKQTLSKIFDPFFTTKFTGRGLGMAAVLGIVRGHKGTVKVYSEPNKGTTFKILLPASSKPAAISNRASVEHIWKGSGTVLLVDDEETVKDIGTEMLKELGFTIMTANDGREAIEIFRTTPGISFVILDLTMPHMDGEQCYRELRQLKPDVKVIISSGFSEQEVTQKFAGKGLAGFIQKPYKLSALKEAIQKI